MFVYIVEGISKLFLKKCINSLVCNLVGSTLYCKVHCIYIILCMKEILK